MEAAAYAAVDRLDLSVAAGELVVLVGPSGAGKTTVLRLVAGLEEPTGGQVLLEGRELTRLLPRDRGVAMVFQSYALYPHLTVAGNLSFGQRREGLSREERALRVSAAARSLGLEPFLDRYPARLSGGEKQRVALGRALLREPKVLLLDEPLSSLDPGLRAAMRLELRRFHRRLGTATLHVTHDQVEAMTLGDRLVVMAEGRVEQVGTPEEIYRAPRTAFVARFLGNPGMNLLPATVRSEAGCPEAGCSGDGRSEDGRLALRVAGADLDLRLRGRTGPAGGSVTWGIRPEALRVAAPERGRIRGRAEVVESQGKERLAHIVVGGGDGRESLQVLLPPDQPLEAGEEVSLDFEDRSVHLFDPTGGKSLFIP